MADLRFIRSTNPALLLDAAAEAFLKGGEIPYLLALRQGGLRDDLIARAATLGVPGWFDPPLCTFAELPERFGLDPRNAIGDFERVVLLDAVARREAGDLFGKLTRAGAFLDALDRWIGDLIQEGVSAERLESLLERLPDRDDFEQRRDAELLRIYRAWGRELEQASLRDPRAARIDVAQLIEREPERLEEALHGRREIRFLGLHDLKGGWGTLLKTLAGHPALDRVIIYGADPAPAEELGIPVEELTGEHEVKVSLISAPDPERELATIAVRIRSLLDSGVPPARIAVVARSARPTVDLAVDALGRLGIPAAARRRIAFADIPAVNSLAILFAAAAEGWTRHALAELSAQPYLNTGLDQYLVNRIGFERPITGLAAWETALQELRDRARKAESGEVEEDDRRTPLPPSERIEEALDRFRTFRETVHPLDGERPLTEWLGWLTQALDEDRWNIERAVMRVPDDRFDVVRRDLAGWRALGRAVREWQQAVSRWGANDGPMKASQFHARLTELLSADAALWTPTHRGVRVLEGLAAAYRAFDHVFVVGMETGSFPRRMPPSPIMGDHERDALAELGLPLETRNVWDRREQTLFTLLRNSATQVTLSYARLDERGREVAPSAFFEDVQEETVTAVEVVRTGEVLTPGYPVWGSEQAGAQAVHGAAIEHTRALEEVNPWSGLITSASLLETIAGKYGEDYVWSPTQLESFAKCPWAWFSERILKLELLEDPEPDMDPATRGTVLHDALKRFYDALKAERGGGPVFLLEKDLVAVTPVLQTALDDALEVTGAERWIGHPALRATKRAELWQMLYEYVKWEIELNEDTFNGRKNQGKTVRTAVDEHELGFDNLLFERNGVRFRLRGHIDRVEVEHDDMAPPAGWVAAVDYKSSKWSTPGTGKKQAWEEKIVLQVPLYAWALETMRPGTRAARVEYRAIKQRELVHVLRLVSVRRKTGETTENDDERAKMEAALDAAVEHVKRARSGEYPAEYTKTAGCSKWCQGWDICRVKGGPQSVFDF